AAKEQRYFRAGVVAILVDMTPEELADLAHLRRARDLMDREYAQPLDVPAMARAALMSPAHFSRKFRAAYGETPYAYLMTRRIERAKPAAARDVGHRHVHGGRLYVARVVQLAVHRDRGRDAVAVPRARPRRAPSRPALREQGRDPPAAYPGDGLTPSSRIGEAASAGRD